jgi:hypothetical protein
MSISIGDCKLSDLKHNSDRNYNQAEMDWVARVRHDHEPSCHRISGKALAIRADLASGWPHSERNESRVDDEADGQKSGNPYQIASERSLLTKPEITPLSFSNHSRYATR